MSMMMMMMIMNARDTSARVRHEIKAVEQKFN